MATNDRLLELDGKRLYYSFIAGARKIIQHQVDLNKINVFPVPDADTGTNLASTTRSILENIKPDKSFKITADCIANAALYGARGNSGIIFAQFFYGLSVETSNLPKITLIDFAGAIHRSIKYLYGSVANPVEGTMLTVIREWAEYIYKYKDVFTDFLVLLVKSYEVLKQSLLKTTNKLGVLAQAHVVDAGAKGFVLFIEGVLELAKSKNIKEFVSIKHETIDAIEINEIVNEETKFRYCTEALIKDGTIEKAQLYELLQSFGDSVVVAGSDKLQRIHVHTNTPALLFEKIQPLGTITMQKADDMVRQYETAHKRKWNIALVTDSTCDIPQAFIDHYQITMLPLHIYFGENHYLDKLTLQPQQFYKLLEETPRHPSSAQLNEKALVNVYSHLASHYDAVIALHVTDKFSGTYANSKRAAGIISKEFNKNLEVINSRQVSGSLGLVTLRTAMAIEQGMDFPQIVSSLHEWIDKCYIFVSVKTLRYMVKGGRVSPMKGLLAKLMNVKPIVSLDKVGNSLIFGKTFSQHGNMRKVMKHIRHLATNKTVWNYVVLHANNPEDAQWYSNEMKTLTNKEPISVLNISPVVGMNAGVGATSVAIMFE